MKIFWSWQSDTPGKTGRFLVRDALEAISQLKQAPEIEEPTSRETREALHLDHDIQGATGSPDLARTILDKIDISEVVIADVTLVGKTPDAADGNGNTLPGKKLINSNVAIELGYALHRLKDTNVLMVFNEHYGSHEDLPFDLRHKGGAITFDLSPAANKKEIEQQQRTLKERFVTALKPFIQKKIVAIPFSTETPSTFNKGIYFGERRGPGEGRRTSQGAGHLFVRAGKLMLSPVHPRGIASETPTTCNFDKSYATGSFVGSRD